jgi:TonB-linked SusC/RagA family outer membrane protein
MKKKMLFQNVKFLFLFFLITITSVSAQVAAQQLKKVTGTVTEASTGDPIPGATILIKGTTTGTVTDFNGNYSINVEKTNATLVFSFVGYSTQSIVVGNKTTLDVKMDLDIAALDEVVVTGYSTVAKKNLTSAVASADVGSMQKRAVPDVAQAIQGNVAGVNVSAGNGNPGSDMIINIRGVSSFSGDNTPLVIVDGVQVEGGLKNINSNDIKSIQVLKDAASAAIYGSRAANGVILITTKKGEKSDKATVSYNSYFGTQLPYKGISIANSKEYITILQRMYGNDLSGGNLVPQAALDYIADPSKFKDYNWQKEIFSAAPMQSHDLSVSGGGTSGTYRISTGYVNQDGIAFGTGYERANVRANADFIVSDHIKIGQSFAYSKSSTLKEPYAFTRSLYGNAIKMYPYFSPKLPNGDWQTSSFYYGGGDNPEALIRNPFHYASIWEGKTTNSELSVNMYAEIKIFEGLSYKINGAYSQLDYRYREFFGDKGQFQDEYFDPNKSLTEQQHVNFNWNIDNLLRYQKIFGKHAVDITAGFISQKFGYTSINAYKESFLSSTTSTLDGPGGKNTQAGGGKQESSLLSYIAQAFYSYDNRYLLTVNFRRDGSSRFAPDYRWGNFPGVSLGWRVSNEKIWKNSGLTNVIKDFKIRAGYGVLGRQNLGNYSYVPTLQYDPAVFGESIQDGLIVGNPINQEISWEKLISKTIGVDYELVGGKVSGSFDYYNNDSRDMIIGVAIAPSVGGGELQTNAGEINNKGFEMSLSYKDKIGEFKYNFGFNLGTTKTTLNNFGRDIATGDWFAQPEWDTEWVTELHKGGGLSEYWLIKTDGLFRSQAEINNYKSSNGTVIQPNAKPGDIKFIDADDNGEISSDGDRQYCGSGVPKVNLGFNLSASYKDFDLFIGATGAFGQVIYNGTQYLAEKNRGYQNFSTNLLNAYDPSTNPNSNFPRLNPNDPEDNYNSRPTSNRYIENGNYLKIRTLEFGYTLPSSLINRVKMSSARIFVRGQNLATFTRYSGADPEIGGSPIVNQWSAYATLYTAGLDRDTEPQARSFQVGVNVTF